jgi:hypothetical protein
VDQRQPAKFFKKVARFLDIKFAYCKLSAMQKNMPAENIKLSCIETSVERKEFAEWWVGRTLVRKATKLQ